MAAAACDHCDTITSLGGSSSGALCHGCTLTGGKKLFVGEVAGPLAYVFVNLGPAHTYTPKKKDGEGEKGKGGAPDGASQLHVGPGVGVKGQG